MWRNPSTIRPPAEMRDKLADAKIRACGGIGIRARLKIVWSYDRVGSTPTTPTKK